MGARCNYEESMMLVRGNGARDIVMELRFEVAPGVSLAFDDKYLISYPKGKPKIHYLKLLEYIM